MPGGAASFSATSPTANHGGCSAIDPTAGRADHPTDPTASRAAPARNGRTAAWSPPTDTSRISDRRPRARADQLLMLAVAALLEVGQGQHVVEGRPSSGEVPLQPVPIDRSACGTPRRRDRPRSSPPEGPARGRCEARSGSQRKSLRRDRVILDHRAQSVVERLPRLRREVTQGAVGHPAAGRLENVVIQRLEQLSINAVDLSALACRLGRPRTAQRGIGRG